jgi:hypothetical protein
MKQEDKELLLRDLCGRLPYGVKIDVIYSKDSGSSLRARLCSEGINTLDTNILWLFQQSEIYIKPYLLPLSSMTEEQYKEYTDMSYSVTERYWSIANYHQIEWFNKNHFDYRGLIPKGSAIDATGLNIY